MDASDFTRIGRAIKDGILSHQTCATGGRLVGAKRNLAEMVMHELEMNGYRVVKMTPDEIVADRTLSKQV